MDWSLVDDAGQALQDSDHSFPRVISTWSHEYAAHILKGCDWNNDRGASELIQ